MSLSLDVCSHLVGVRNRGDRPSAAKLHKIWPATHSHGRATTRLVAVHQTTCPAVSTAAAVVLAEFSRASPSPRGLVVGKLQDVSQQDAGHHCFQRVEEVVQRLRDLIPCDLQEKPEEDWPA